MGATSPGILLMMMCYKFFKKLYNGHSEKA